MRIPARFRGPPESANGGYACGTVALALDGDAEVTLRSPPPLDRELVSERTPAGVIVRDGDRVVAEARPSVITIEPPEPVAYDEAVEAARGYVYRDHHPFPTCFVCGPARAEGDGLRIFPGAVAGRRVAAAPWIPDASVAGSEGIVRPEITWAVLDCPSWFGMVSFEPWNERMALLGRLAAHIEEAPRAGERLVAAGWLVRREGRKIHCGSAIYGEDGSLRAKAQATWIALA